MAVSDPYSIAVESTPGTSAARAFSRAYGVDLRWRDGFEVASNGDVREESGLDVLRANFERALVVTPGEIFWRPDYGIGIGTYLGRKLSASTLEELRTRISSWLLRQPLVERVDPLKLYVSLDLPGVLEIHLGVRVASQDSTWSLTARAA